MTSLDIPAEFTLHRKVKYDHSSPVRWIFSHLSPYWWIMIMLVTGAIGNAVLAVVVPVLTGDAFNAMLAPQPDTSVLLPLAITIGVSQVIRGVLQLGRNFGAELLAQKMERDIRDELYLSLLGKSMTFHNLQPVGDTMARATNDVREVNYMFSPGVNLVVGSFMFILMPLFFGPRYHPSLVLTPLIFIAIYFVALVRYLKVLSPVTDTARATFGQMNTHLSESLDGVEIMKGSAQEEAEVDRFVTNARKVRDAFVQQGDLEARYIAMLLLGLAFAGGLTHALFLLRAGLINVGAVIGYFGMLQLLGFPTFTSTFAYSQISLGMSSARRILELIQSETKLDQNASGVTSEIRGEIEFRNVSFHYPGSDNVLEDISFKVKPGQTVAIVGQTGAGKTTLVKLINRIYDVTEGQVFVDGLDVRDWNLASLRSQISIIEQDIFLFSRTLSDNIAFGKPGATKDEIMAASIAAQAHDFILDFDETYGTVVGERGVTLSGGQRQRIALARAFLTDPRVLVLDDSTSAIDSATEDKIQRAISNASRGRTTFIITHRLSQIRWADLIIVLRKGHIAAIGSHDELMKTSEAYSRIFRE
ncbi:MAG TPA: ABC transporter ATP-binding protein [Anaerolineales bacterium]|nr:ABC transporter ATP-binding protein [Anaerolineales bacterium]HNB37239.1 ABC transporter ATP-binding protein [Anaerolineales bacterium]HNC08222.1 ABC transporter ATP-binding protein [Anaerolineales bacterium]